MFQSVQVFTCQHGSNFQVTSKTLTCRTGNQYFSEVRSTSCQSLLSFMIVLCVYLVFPSNLYTLKENASVYSDRKFMQNHKALEEMRRNLTKPKFTVLFIHLFMIQHIFIVHVSHDRHCAVTLGGINMNQSSSNHVLEIKSMNRNYTFSSVLKFPQNSHNF